MCWTVKLFFVGQPPFGFCLVFCFEEFLREKGGAQRLAIACFAFLCLCLALPRFEGQTCCIFWSRMCMCLLCLKAELATLLPNARSRTNRASGSCLFWFCFVSAVAVQTFLSLHLLGSVAACLVCILLHGLSCPFISSLSLSFATSIHEQRRSIEPTNPDSQSHTHTHTQR